MLSPRPLIAGALLCFARLAASQSGTGGETVWAVGVSALADDESNRGAAVSLDVSVAEATWVSAFAARSESASERAAVSADTIAVGLDHRFKHVGFRIGAERWGDSGAIESRDYRAAVYLFTDRVTFDIGLERRDIDATATLVGLDGRVLSRKVPLSADGRSLIARVAATERVTLRFAIEDYDYPPGLALLPRIDRLNLLSTSTLTLANSFLSEVHAVGLDLALGNKVFGLNVVRDRSAIDRSELTSFDAALLLPVGRRVDLELSIGRSSSELFRSDVFGGVLVLVYGGG